MTSINPGHELGKWMWRTRARFWGLRLTLVLFGLLPFFAMEFALRVFWRPQPNYRLDPYLDCSQLSPLFELQEGSYRTSTNRLRLFASTEFSARKGKGTKRIFCLGGSTTQGEPYKPPTAFPAWLKLNLQLIDPNQSWEVINCGGLSYASDRLLPMLIEILHYEPDLVQQIIALDPDHAAALYWLGQFELSNGQIELARQHLVEARDRDVCPLRAVSSMQSAIREQAINEKVWLFDVDSLFQSVSDHGMVGNKWLIDHVHPRIEGHQLLGEHLANFLIQKGWITPMEQDWKQDRTAVYRERLKQLGEDYFFHGKQRLEGLLMWTQGRASKGLKQVNPK